MCKNSKIVNSAERERERERGSLLKTLRMILRSGISPASDGRERTSPSAIPQRAVSASAAAKSNRLEKQTSKLNFSLAEESIRARFSSRATEGALWYPSFGSLYNSLPIKSSLSLLFEDSFAYRNGFAVTYYARKPLLVVAISGPRNLRSELALRGRARILRVSWATTDIGIRRTVRCENLSILDLTSSPVQKVSLIVICFLLIDFLLGISDV